MALQTSHLSLVKLQLTEKLSPLVRQYSHAQFDNVYMLQFHCSQKFDFHVQDQIKHDLKLPPLTYRLNHMPPLLTSYIHI